MEKRVTVHDIRQFDSDGMRGITHHKYEFKEGIIRYGLETEKFYLERARRLYAYEAVDRIILLSEFKYKADLENLAKKILEKSHNEWRRNPDDWLIKENNYVFKDKIEIVDSERKNEEEIVNIIQIDIISSLYSTTEYYLSEINKNPGQLPHNLVRILAGLYPKEWREKLPKDIPHYNPKDILKLLTQMTEDTVLITHFDFFYEYFAKKDLKIEEMLKKLENLLKSTPGYPESLKDLNLILRAIHRSLLSTSLSEVRELKNEVDDYLQKIPNPEHHIDILFRRHLELFGFLQKFNEANDLHDKLYFLEESRRKIRESEVLVTNKFVEPFKTLYLNILGKWMDMTFEEGKRLLCRVSLELGLQTKRIVWKEDLLISLGVKNIGLDTVQNISVALDNSPDYTISGENNKTITVLPRNRNEYVEFHINTVKKDSINPHFSIISETNEKIEFSDTLLFAEPGKFVAIPNPYNFTGPAEGEMFYNREDLFQWIETNMKKPTVYQNVLIMGQRRTGKTSFLKELKRRFENGHYSIFLDIESYPKIGDIDFLFTICDELHRTNFSTLIPPNPQEFVKKSYAAFGDYIRYLLDNTDSREIILIFDEFDKVETYIKNGDFRPGFLLFLRAFLQHTPHVTALIGGKFEFGKLFSQEWGEFFTIFNPKIIGALDEESATALVTQPVKDFLQYDSYAIKKILDFSGRNPFYIQLICHTLINYLNEQGKNFAENEDVSAAIFNEARERAEPTLLLTWEELDQEEKNVLYILSRLKMKHKRSIELKELEDYLRENNIKMRTWKLTSLLGILREKGIVTKSGELSLFYDFDILLLGDWIAEHGMLGGG